MEILELDAIAKYFGRIRELMDENARLEKQAETALEKARFYRGGMKDMQASYEDQILNYKGALKRRQDETHVLYHKISTLLGELDLRPEGYDSLSDINKRAVLKELLDEMQPKGVKFVGTDITYTLTEFGVEPDVDPVSQYPERTGLYFC